MIFFAVFGVCTAANRPFEPLNYYPLYDGEKAKIGKELFGDTRLSKDFKKSCQTCHDVLINGNGTNKKIFSPNPPTILNATLNYYFYSDGSIKDLNLQIQKSLTSKQEMGSNEKLILDRIYKNYDYRQMFEKAYENGITFENIVDALSHFQRSLTTPNSKFDKFLLGNEKLSEDEEKGFELFVTKGCAACHNGINLGGNIMVNFVNNLSNLQTSQKRRRVPTLRNIALTAPYTYYGKEKDIRSAINHIARSRQLVQLDKKSVDLIYKFLLTLTGERPKILNE